MRRGSWLVSAAAAALSLGCAGGPRPEKWPPAGCGTDRGEWTLAELSPTYTRVLGRARWSAWLRGDVAIVRKAARIPVRVRPSADAELVTVLWAGEEYEMWLHGTGGGSCYFLSLEPGLALYRIVGPVPEIVYLRVFGGWVGIAPRGGPVR